MTRSIENLRYKLVSLSEKIKKEGFYNDFNYFFKRQKRFELDKVNIGISETEDEGIKLRIWDNEKFIEFGTNILDYEYIEKESLNLLKEVVDSQSSIKEKVKLKFDVKKSSEDFKGKPKEDMNSKSVEEKIKILENIKIRIQNYSEDIVNAKVIFIEKFEKNIFINPYKNMSQEIPLCILANVAFLKSDSGMKTAFESYTDNGLEVIEKSLNDFDKFTSYIDNLKKAKKLKGGKYKVFLSPKISGLLAHESFGHGMEADTMRKGRALASKYKGNKIAGNNINIVDYGNVSGKHGELFFDNDGNLSRKTYLVKNGVINEEMADLYSKTKLNLKFSSNSRFESFDHKNYVRMTNTYFEPGKEKSENMISSIEDGIYIISAGGGMEDPKSWGVQIQNCFGQRIKNGELIDEFYDGFTFTGFLPDIMKNISGISNDFEIEGAGHCGKGHKEWVRVSEGGPYLLIDEVILG